MISFRKISAASKGKLIRAYLSEGTALDDAGSKLATYYIGCDPRASWRPDMAPAAAQAVGINPARVPGDEALERLFEAKRTDTGEAWTANKRSISAYDFTASQVGAPLMRRAAFRHPWPTASRCGSHPRARRSLRLPFRRATWEDAKSCSGRPPCPARKY